MGAVAVLVAGLTAACGGSSSSGSTSQKSLGKSDTLTITTFGDFGYDDLIKQWNANPKSPFQVKQTKIAQWDNWKATLTSDLQAGTGLPDVVAIEGDSMPMFLAPGASDQFVDLTDHSLDNRWIAYKYKAGQTASGEQIGYPTDAGPEAMCYNAPLLQKAGISTKPADLAKTFGSWNSYFAAGEQFVKKVPTAKWYDSSGSIAQAMLNQTTYPFQTADNKVDVNNPELKSVYDTVTKYAPTLSTRIFPQFADDWTAAAAKDGFATMPCPGWALGTLQDAAPKVTGWKLADAFPGGGGNWGGSFLAVPKQSKHQAQAKEFANWLTDTTQQVGAFNAAGAYPSNAAAEQQITTAGKPNAYFGNQNTAAIFADRAKAVDPAKPYKGDKYSDILALFQAATQRVDQGKSASSSWATFVQAVGEL